MKRACATWIAKLPTSAARWPARLSARERVSRPKSLPTNVNEYLGILKYRDFLAEKKNEIGLTTGLAWTEVGG